MCRTQRRFKIKIAERDMDKKNEKKIDKKKKPKEIGKINLFLYTAIYAVLKPFYTIRYGITFDREVVKDIKGPAIVLARHTGDVDHILSALTLYPVRPTYIVSEHFVRNKSTAWLVRLAHVITKKMFTPDVSTIINVLRAKKENAVIVIFPEGRQPCHGHSLPVSEGTAELIKKLGVNVYNWRADGGYLTFPKWRVKGDVRRGRINATIKLLLSADDVTAKSIPEIKEIVEGALLHDDELAMAGVEYKCKDMTKGLDKILYKCPSCLEEWKITAGENHIRCSCGLDATLDNKYRLHGAPFDRVNEWFDWQQDSINPEEEHLESKVRLGCCGADEYMDPNAGEGEIYIDKDEFRLSGVMHGEPIEFTVKTEKIGAFPFAPGDHFDIYHGGKLIYVYPLPDLRASVKWVCYLDKFNADRKKKELEEKLAAEKANNEAVSELENTEKLVADNT